MRGRFDSIHQTLKKRGNEQDSSDCLKSKSEESSDQKNIKHRLKPFRCNTEGYPYRGHQQVRRSSGHGVSSSSDESSCNNYHSDSEEFDPLDNQTSKSPNKNSETETESVEENLGTRIQRKDKEESVSRSKKMGNQSHQTAANKQCKIKMMKKQKKIKSIENVK